MYSRPVVSAGRRSGHVRDPRGGSTRPDHVGYTRVHHHLHVLETTYIGQTNNRIYNGEFSEHAK